MNACSAVTGPGANGQCHVLTVGLVASNAPQRINYRRLAVGSTCITPTTSTPLRQRPNALMTSWLKCHGLYTGCGLDHPGANEVRYTFYADEGRVGLFVSFRMVLAVQQASHFSQDYYIDPRSIVRLRKLFVKARSLRPNYLCSTDVGWRVGRESRH